MKPRKMTIAFIVGCECCQQLIKTPSRNQIKRIKTGNFSRSELALSPVQVRVCLTSPYSISHHLIGLDHVAFDSLVVLMVGIRLILNHQLVESPTAEG